MTDATVAINWSHLTQPEFDRRVEALVRREYPDAQVDPRNGRGGDGGIDILVTEPDNTRTIFQLKFFPEGFTGGYAATRRRQIKKSYAQAMRKEQPNQWVLVYPGTLTTSEQRFVDGLKSDDHDAEKVIWNRTELDVRFAHHADLAAYFARSQFQHLAEVLHAEQAVITHVPTDLTARLQALAGTVDQVDPNWTMDFARHGGTTFLTPRARHNQAHVVSPITMRPTFDLSALSPEELSDLRGLFDYGLDRKVQITEPALVRLEIDGPAWIRNDSSGGSLELGPAGSALAAGLRVELRFPDGNSFTGETTFGGHGGVGYSIRLRIAAATIEMLLPEDQTAPATLNVTTDLGSASIADVLQTGYLTRALGSNESMQVFLSSMRLMTATLGRLDLDRDAYEETIALAEDIQAAQRHARAYFPFPDSLTNFDRAGYRVIRLLLEGHRVTMPLWRQLTVTLSGGDDPSLRDILAGEPVWLRFGRPDLEIEIDGRTYNLGPATVLALVKPDEDDRLEALSALDTKTAEGQTVRVRPVDGQNFTAFLSERGRWGQDDSIPLTRWGLGDFWEPGMSDPEVEQ